MSIPPLESPIFAQGFLVREFAEQGNDYALEFARQYAERVVPFGWAKESVTVGSAVFGNTAAHQQLAREFDAEFVPVDLRKTVVEQLEHVTPSAAAPKRVVLFGCESTGKSQLAKALAAHYQTLFSEEYARTYFTFFGEQGTLADIPRTARGQFACNNAAAKLSNKVVFCDTDLLLTQIWSEVLFGTSPEVINQTAALNLGDFYLLTDIDLPWEPDPQRCLPNRKEREAFQARCEELLQQHDCPYAKIRGAGEARTQAALQALKALNL